jgi:hypothetical protein
MYEEYISKVERLCGPGNDYLIVVKYEVRDKLVNSLLDRAEKIEFSSNLMWRIIFDGKRMNIFRTGKIIIKSISDDELSSLLDKIFSKL